MAFTDSQKADIRRFLGYTDRSQGYYSLLEGVMTVVSADAEAKVGTILTDLGTIETTLRESWGRQKVKRVEDIYLAGIDEIKALRSEGNRLARHIASILGVQVRVYPFFSGGSSGIAGRG